MNPAKIHPSEDNLSEMPLLKRILGATAATILIVWWGIHLNSLIQAVVAASDTQLTIPSGTHRLVGMDTSANIAAILVYVIGLAILVFTVGVALPIFVLVPRSSQFWRLPVFILLGCSVPICVIIVESLSGFTRSPDKWTNAGFNHLAMDTAGYMDYGQDLYHPKVGPFCVDGLRFCCARGSLFPCGSPSPADERVWI